MASARLEARVAALEAEVAQLKRKLEEQETLRPWWEQIVGTFQNEPLMNAPRDWGSTTASRYGRSRLRHAKRSSRVMIGLDTDHLSVQERSDQPGSGTLRARLADLPPAAVVTTIISYEEQKRGWMGVSGTDAVRGAAGGSLSAAAAASGQRPPNPGVGV